MSKHIPHEGWELNGLRFVSAGMHGETETCHIDDFPVYAAAPDLLDALTEMVRLYGKRGRDRVALATALDAIAKATGE
jgi:hypothetical protein